MDPLTIGAIGAGASLLGSVPGAISSYLSSQQQLAAAKRAQGALTGAYNTATGAQQPYAQAGQIGLGQLTGGNFGTAVPGQYAMGQAPQYSAPQFNFQQDPGYQFSLQQGLGAINSGAAGQGAGLSGATLKAMSKFGINIANQQYGDVFNRYMQGRQQGFQEYLPQLQQFNVNRGFGAGQQQQQYENLNQQQNQAYGRAANLAGIGQGAATNLSNLATGYGQNLAGLYGQQGNVQAAGTMGVGQGIGTGLQNAGQAFMLSQLMGKK